MKRIEKMLSLIDSHIGVADVGTDHGLLPVSLALQGYRGNLVATDIHELPLQTAMRQAEESGVKDRILFCLTDGLDGLDPSMIDTIVVAGLGGDVICSILDRAEWTMNPRYQLLLQPMTKAEVLRFWLCNNGGIDFFDCVMPARNGRHGHLFTWNGIINIRNEKYLRDEAPIDPECDCPVCRRYSRAYLRHLFKAEEMLAMRFSVMHNLFFYNNLMEKIRLALEAGRYGEFRARYSSVLDRRI